MSYYFTLDALSALFQVMMIDLVLAGDNAIVIGLAAAGLPKEQRARAILIAGRPLKEPIAQYGPFVMNSHAEIHQAVDDFRAGRLA